jgi:hypothetical protein
LDSQTIAKPENQINLKPSKNLNTWADAQDVSATYNEE